MARKSPVRQSTHVEDGKFYNVWEQPDRGLILAENARRRGFNPRKSDWIKPMATIPLEDREVLKRKRPDLFEDRRKMEKWLNSSEGRPYSNTPRGRSRNFSFGGK
jgi:hypothetical protein